MHSSTIARLLNDAVTLENGLTEIKNERDWHQRMSICYRVARSFTSFSKQGQKIAAKLTEVEQCNFKLQS